METAMLSFYSEHSIWALLAMLYLVLFIIKLTICFADITTVAGVMERRCDAEGVTYSQYLVIASVAVVFIVFLRLPYALWKEGPKFFMAYHKRRVIRDVLAGL